MKSDSANRYCWRLAVEHQEREEKEEAYGACDLPRPQAILDNAGTVLAVGQRRRDREDAGSTADGHFPARP